MAKGKGSRAKTAVVSSITPATERKWRAEDMVRGAMMASPQFQKACRVAEKELGKADAAVKKAVLKKGG